MLVLAATDQRPRRHRQRLSLGAWATYQFEVSGASAACVLRMQLLNESRSGGHGFKVRQLTITDEGGGLAADGGKGTGAITTRRRAAKQRVTRKQREMIKDSYRRRD